MKMRFTLSLLLLTMMTQSAIANDHVVLLHGLCRSPSSMNRMEKALESEGYKVHNMGYESRHHNIEKLAKDVRQRIAEETEGARQIHFVTHSMGGILVRHIQATAPIENIGRVVMLSPPNQGSEVADKIGHWWLYKKINGPAGQQLGTDDESLVKQLGPINFDCAVITGDRSINWINSLMIPGSDDGKVSTTSSRIEGATAHKVVHLTHPMIMKRRVVIDNVISFLENGAFAETNNSQDQQIQPKRMNPASNGLSRI